MGTPEICYIALGSNLDNPHEHIKRAFIDLAHLADTQLLAQSSRYRSKPLGPQNQPDFINAAAKLATHLEPLNLLAALQRIELKHGRERRVRWGPRTLDLDILLYGNLVMQTPTLTLPHPEMQQRSFVLLPLAEIADEDVKHFVLAGHSQRSQRPAPLPHPAG